MTGGEAKIRLWRKKAAAFLCELFPLHWRMTYEILLIVVIGGIGSITGSVVASFLFVGCSEWWLRFLDNETTLKNFNAKLIFAIVFGLIVLGLAVVILRRDCKKGLPPLRRITAPGGGKRVRVNWSAIASIVLAVALLGWDVWFVISPNLKLPLLRSGFRMPLVRDDP